MVDSGEKKGPGALEQHPYVEKLRPDPSRPPTPVVTRVGLLGRSDRPGYQRLYFTRDLATFAEFLTSDVLYVEPVPAADSPIPGIDASRISLPQDATIHYTRSTKATALDEFDLNLRTAPGAQSFMPQAGADTAPMRCGTDTQNTHQTQCGPATCNTCQTQCGQATCNNTCNTCQTQCGQATCNTCQTCQTQCHGCPPTTNHHMHTCGPDRHCL